MGILSRTQKTDDEVLAENTRLVGADIAAVRCTYPLYEDLETDQTRHYRRGRNLGGENRTSYVSICSASFAACLQRRLDMTAPCEYKPQPKPADADGPKG